MADLLPMRPPVGRRAGEQPLVTLSTITDRKMRLVTVQKAHNRERGYAALGPAPQRPARRPLRPVAALGESRWRYVRVVLVSPLAAHRRLRRCTFRIAVVVTPVRAAAARGVAAAVAPMPPAGVVLVVVAFVALESTNSAAVSVMNLFVTRSLGLDVGLAGAALGLSAALEIPALLLVGRLGHRVSDIRLITAGSVIGIGYYAGMPYASGPAVLLALQAFNAPFFAAVSGVGISLFQRVIPRAGLASGL